MKKIIGLYLCMLMIIQIIPITESTEIINSNVEEPNENQSIPKYPFQGMLIGRISNVDQFSNKDYITCQAVSVYYNGVVIIRPPHVIDELEGRLYSGDIKIFRPYVGLLTQNYICAWVNADKEVFYSNGTNISLLEDFSDNQNDLSLIESMDLTIHENDDTYKVLDYEEFVEIVIEICAMDETQENILQLPVQDAMELEIIFEDMKSKLDTAITREETVVIFNDAVVSLNEFGLLPDDMSVKEAQQLVTNGNHEAITLNKINDRIQPDNNEDENFDCFIVGKTSSTTFIKTGLHILFQNVLPILILSNTTIAFGYDGWSWGGGSGDYFREPANGWVWTNGVNGIKTWNEDSLWGNLGSYYYTSGGWVWYEYWFHKGATGFTGIRIKGLSDSYFFGTASHVSLSSEFPGKNQPIEIQNSHISQHSLLSLRFLEQFPILNRLLYLIN